jgi:hypothetical protein
VSEIPVYRPLAHTEFDRLNECIGLFLPNRIEVTLKADFSGTLASFADSGFMQVPQSFACGVSQRFPTELAGRAIQGESVMVNGVWVGLL